MAAKIATVPMGVKLESCASAIEQMVASLRRGRVLCLTGAGCSTESGIPDYRSPGGSYSRGYKPMQHSHFMRSEYQRRRYWARSFHAWPSMSARQPNGCHLAIRELQQRGAIDRVITQNVDGLHGRERVLDLHGRLDSTRCVDCELVTDRNEWQEQLALLNPELAQRIDPNLELDRSDGDAEVGEEDIATFRLPPCKRCGGGRTKPHVVLFGDMVPQPRVQQGYAAVEAADSLLVVGTSLAVFSSWRFAKEAAKLGKPIHIVNIGPTRADLLAASKAEARVSEVMAFLRDLC